MVITWTTQEQLSLAEALAKKKHKGQFRRDGITPYLRHVDDVADRVHTTEEKIVARLHDIIEDTDTTKNDLLLMGFSPKFVDAVVLLTKHDGYVYEDYMKAIKANPLAKVVKIADMRANLADSPTKNQIRRYSDGILYLTT